MTALDRFDPFERRITDAIDEIAAARPPEYLNDILRQTARSSQRPRWTFPERWLPVDIASSRPGLLRANPARLVLVILVLAALAAAAWAGSRLLDRPSLHLPAPFGPAGNGLVAFSDGSDLFLGDPNSGSTRLFAAGVGTDPVFDRTGTRVATSRTSPAGAHCYGPPPIATCTTEILVTDVRGRSVNITREPFPYPAIIQDWSADGTWILVTVGPSDMIVLVAADGSGVREVPAFANFVLPRFAPPDSGSIWIDERAPMGGLLPMRVGLDGQALSRFTPLPGRENLVFDAAPGGERIAMGGMGSSVVIARLDGSVERSIELGPDVDSVGAIAWSPAGDMLVVTVVRNAFRSVSLVDPSGAISTRPLRPHLDGCSWAPDGGSLLCEIEGGFAVVDRFGGVRLTGWQIGNFPPSWQRLALAEDPE